MTNTQLANVITKHTSNMITFPVCSDISFHVSFISVYWSCLSDSQTGLALSHPPPKSGYSINTLKLGGGRLSAASCLHKEAQKILILRFQGILQNEAQHFKQYAISKTQVKIRRGSIKSSPWYGIGLGHLLN